MVLGPTSRRPSPKLPIPQLDTANIKSATIFGDQDASSRADRLESIAVMLTTLASYRGPVRRTDKNIDFRRRQLVGLYAVGQFHFVDRRLRRQ